MPRFPPSRLVRRLPAQHRHVLERLSLRAGIAQPLTIAPSNVRSRILRYMAAVARERTSYPGTATRTTMRKGVRVAVMTTLRAALPTLTTTATAQALYARPNASPRRMTTPALSSKLGAGRSAQSTIYHHHATFL